MALIFNRKVRFAFDRAVNGLTGVGNALIPALSPERYGIRLTRDIPYRPTGRRSHRLDIYQPSGNGPAPIIFYVHGGGFSILSKDTHRIMALKLAQRGYMVVSTNYRVGTQYAYPAPLEDVVTSLGWVLDHAAEYGGDVDRLALMGDSAGANLVTALTYMATHHCPEPFARQLYHRAPHIRATIPVYGIHDVHDIERLWRGKHWPTWVKNELREVSQTYLGRRQGLNFDSAPLASPLRLIEQNTRPRSRQMPPFLTAAGTRDPVLDDSRRLTQALRSQGVECEFHIFPGEIHAFNVMLWRPAARSHWRRVYRFLHRHVRQARTSNDTLPPHESSVLNAK